MLAKFFILVVSALAGACGSEQSSEINDVGLIDHYASATIISSEGNNITVGYCSEFDVVEIELPYKLKCNFERKRTYSYSTVKDSTLTYLLQNPTKVPFTDEEVAILHSWFYIHWDGERMKSSLRNGNFEARSKIRTIEAALKPIYDYIALYGRENADLVQLEFLEKALDKVKTEYPHTEKRETADDLRFTLFKTALTKADDLIESLRSNIYLYDYSGKEFYGQKFLTQDDEEVLRWIQVFPNVPYFKKL